ncbi:MAG: hypothetical protein HY582_02645, partial [Candidatus Omnitrophica bacterium]|nr:hypothetical protein [Candidatus Omnitrophota bacterium]
MKKSHLVNIILLLVVGFLLFAPSFQNEFLQLDDPQYVVQNGDIRHIDFNAIQKWFSRDYVLNYIPITMASFAVDYQIWHLDPFGYRLTNFILHAFNAILVYLLIFLTIRNQIVALAVAFLFGVHPVQVESVIWISERKNLLASFFALLSFLFFLKNKKPHAALSFFCAVLSKPSVVVIPLVMAAYEYFFRPSSSKKGKVFFYAAVTSIALIVG